MQPCCINVRLYSNRCPRIIFSEACLSSRRLTSFNLVLFYIDVVSIILKPNSYESYVPNTDNIHIPYLSNILCPIPIVVYCFVEVYVHFVFLAIISKAYSVHLCLYGIYDSFPRKESPGLRYDPN